MAATRLVRIVEEQLAEAGCVAADEEAEEIVALAPDPSTVRAWVERRRRGEPLAWIVGSVAFCGRRVAVDPGVYVPRHQTEQLARRAAELLPPTGRAADLCCGSGAVAVHLQAHRPGALVVATDIDPGAVTCARSNGVRAAVAETGRGLRTGSFDLVSAVAPYVPTGAIRFLPSDVVRYEPHRALDGGPDGLEQVRRVVDAASRLLRPGGWLALELGGDQDRALAGHLSAAGFGPSRVWRDEDGDLRGLVARRLADPNPCDI